MNSQHMNDLPVRAETVMFVGAGATNSLRMPVSQQMANFLWRLCEEDLSEEDIRKGIGKLKCFEGRESVIADLFHVLDSGADGLAEIRLDEDLRERAFPGVKKEDVFRTVTDLRRNYDWHALKLIAKAKKGDVEPRKVDDPKNEARNDYLQEVFTLIDACLREARGFLVYSKGEPIFLPVARLKAARECLVYLTNTMFACAWKKLVESGSNWGTLNKYFKFFTTLAEMMQDEGEWLANRGKELNRAEFYKFSYSIVTTNFDPLFLWFVWQGHNYVNHNHGVRVGNPGRQLKLLMNFPSTVGMRKPADPEDKQLDPAVWFPCTEAVAQNVNNPKYMDNRAFRLGMYSPVHGLSNFRHCPVCGRLNFYPGDTWDLCSKTLFPNGVIKQLAWGQEPRTEREREARERGEYDALSCHFCGSLTCDRDNFMFMQTQLKSAAPSFIKEITDDALSQIAGAKHIILLGYSLPLDDAIWASLLTMMSRRGKGSPPLYCSVVSYDEKGTGRDEWLAGEELEKYVKDAEERGVGGVKAVKNAWAVFGKENVRAYMKGVPDVFGNFSELDVRELMYPSSRPGWTIPEFKRAGVRLF